MSDDTNRDAVLAQLNAAATRFQGLERDVDETIGKFSSAELTDGLRRFLCRNAFIWFTLLVFALSGFYVMVAALGMYLKWSAAEIGAYVGIADKVFDVVKTLYVPVITLILGYFFGQGSATKELLGGNGGSGGTR